MQPEKKLERHYMITNWKRGLKEKDLFFILYFAIRSQANRLNKNNDLEVTNTMYHYVLLH